MSDGRLYSSNLIHFSDTGQGFVQSEDLGLEERDGLVCIPPKIRVCSKRTGRIVTYERLPQRDFDTPNMSYIAYEIFVVDDRDENPILVQLCLFVLYRKVKS